MKFLQALLSLAGAASALDIYFHTGPNCNDASVICSGINPGVCCRAGGITYRSVAYRGIVPSWRIRCRSYQGNGCEIQRADSTVNGVNYQCHSFQNNYNYNGARYDFVNRKRAEDTCAAEDGTCESTQQADTLVLEDGTHLRITELEEDPLEELQTAPLPLTSRRSSRSWRSSSRCPGVVTVTRDRHAVSKTPFRTRKEHTFHVVSNHSSGGTLADPAGTSSLQVAAHTTAAAGTPQQPKTLEVDGWRLVTSAT
ncbi:uncharacterized protein ColSpa_09462 [Colletotrichum spaethianum]|uniref:Uncharacterized protein n=1 Tax=Colletotrichum spaethianum TaxID=700344 RepID=A0AA37PBL6_9PEZI|nr:uncharacterized protein ColSpa_09462 [Colletotrichum spaethianum]GKT49281.1 hypothetical protein ColSpa_09462 [Colletotrichum spaethianum]